MRIALLIGANPRSSRVEGLAIPLRAGTWQITSSPIKDSVITVHANEQSHSINEHFVFPEAGIVSVEFTKRGTEQYVSLFAELVD